MSTVLIYVVLLVVVAGGCYLAYLYGRKQERLDASEHTNRERERDAEIAARPDINRPLGRMRPKG